MFKSQGRKQCRNITWIFIRPYDKNDKLECNALWNINTRIHSPKKLWRFNNVFTHLYSSNDSKIKTVKTRNKKTSKQNVFGCFSHTFTAQAQKRQVVRFLVQFWYHTSSVQRPGVKYVTKNTGVTLHLKVGVLRTGLGPEAPAESGAEPWYWYGVCGTNSPKAERLQLNKLCLRFNTVTTFLKFI